VHLPTEYPHIRLKNVQDHKFIPLFQKNVPPPMSVTKWVGQPPSASQTFQHSPQSTSDITTMEATPSSETSELSYDPTGCNNTRGLSFKQHPS